MVALSRFVKAVYLFALLLAVYLLLAPAPSPAQFRGTHALPTFFIPTLSGSASGSSIGGGGGIVGFSGGSGFAGGSASGSLTFTPFNPSQIFPNGGRIIGMPPPLFQPMLNNLIFPITADSTGSPLAMLIPVGVAGGIGGGVGGGIAGVAGGVGGAGGIVGGGGGIAGGQGFGGGITGGGMGMGGMGVGGMGGGAMGFAGKGMGGFNGRKPL